MTQSNPALMHGYKGCLTDAQCVTCPSNKPDYPTSKCDYEKKQCVKSYECGVSDCSSNSQCCGNPGEVAPHYECSNDYKCNLEYSCGKNECNPKDDFFHKSIG
jgi:hypothetical protein